MLKRFLLRFFLWLINTFCRGTHFFGFKRALLKAAGMKIGKNVKVVAPVYSDTYKVSIGDGTWVGKNLRIHGNGEVEIGKNCDIAPETVFATGSHRIGDETRRAGEGFCGKITVGDGCWICIRSTLLAGVSVGKGSVIAAGAVVSKDTEENSLAGGVPCKKIRQL